MTTKILALTDALGNLVRFRLMPGNRYDSVEVPPLIKEVTFNGLIADKVIAHVPWAGMGSLAAGIGRIFGSTTVLGCDSRVA